MAKIKVVTDSSITIEPELAKDLNITIVPLTVMIVGVVYSDSNLKICPRLASHQLEYLQKFSKICQQKMSKLSRFTCLMLYLAP